MTTVTIQGAANALAAGHWCLTNYNKDDWQLTMGPWGDKPMYDFVFRDPKLATEFILRWQR